MTSFSASCLAAPLVIAEQGKSTLSIVVPKVAAQSVNDAAVEMQRTIAESTQAKLPILKDDEAVTGAFISLGSTRQAQAAGVSAQGIADEGFRILTKAGNLYIIGPDTTAIDLNLKSGRVQTEAFNVEMQPEIPGPALTANGGFSYGTANGVYTFLEDYVGVRWLMPGDIGRDVPRKSTLTINDIDLTHSPQFIYRIVPSLGFNRFAFAWRNQMKMGYSFRLNHQHAWKDIVPPAMFKDHPEWFAMGADGQRINPKGNRNFKYETTNPELVKFVAAKAIETLKAHPEFNTFSLSPSDGLGYSQSPESKAFYDPEYSNINGPSITPLILKFYRDVSAEVAKQYPQGKLAGYLYQQYVYPPSKGSVEIPRNFVPTLVSSASSFGLYREDRRKNNSDILNAWGKVAPPVWFYYGYPTWLRTSESMVMPASPDNLNFLFKDLAKNNIKGMFYYGNPAWSHGALANYLTAKLLWNPEADAIALQHEWLMRAYGPQAGAVMEEFYNKMDESWFSDYFRQPDSTFHNVSEAFFSRVYGAHYTKMEALILKAEAQPMTEVQKERLRLISDNMRVLQWRLRNAGYLPTEYSSPYTINTEQVFKLKSDLNDDRGFIALGGVARSGSEVTPVKIQISQPVKEIAARETAADIPNPEHILLYPTESGTIQLKPANVRPGSSFLYYYVQDEKGSLVTRGILENNKDISFAVKANAPYYLQTRNTGVTLNPKVEWEIAIPNAHPAQAGFKDDVLTLNATPDSKKGTVYVFVPGGLNRVATGTDTGVLIQTQTTRSEQRQTRRYAGRAAAAALATALEQYQGTLIQNLDAGWKFSTDPDKTGVQQGFARADFADKPWAPINTIGPWQAHGFDKYHGTAWYRKTFTVAASDIEPTWLGAKKLLLFVGAVDGDAVFYLNGQKIAERKQADYFNSWEVPFALDISSSLREGKNTLAVQVTKDRLASGLYKGVSLIAGTPKKE